MLKGYYQKRSFDLCFKNALGVVHHIGVIFLSSALIWPHDMKTLSALLQMAGNQSFDALSWRHNGRDGVSNHQPHDCLLNRLLGRRSKKTSKLRVTGLCVVNSPHKWPVTRKMCLFHDVFMVFLVISMDMPLSKNRVDSDLRRHIVDFLWE